LPRCERSLLKGRNPRCYHPGRHHAAAGGCCPRRHPRCRSRGRQKGQKRGTDFRWGAGFVSLQTVDF